jgi:DNA processing protein
MRRSRLQILADFSVLVNCIIKYIKLMDKITIKNYLYPQKLARLNDPPLEIFTKGNASLLDVPSLSVVGSRKVSAYGRSVTEKLVREVAAHGVVIISGLAFGVDVIAHQAALSVGGKTIAVLPGSVDNIYPKNHIYVAQEIINNDGLIVSEYRAKSTIFKQNFIARNRIIAALGDCLLITEAAQKSGSLHTAGFALDLGKDILAVPGPIDNFNYIGSNNLIKSGAKIVTDASDILDIFGLSCIENKEIIASTKEEYEILNLISSGVIDDDEIQSHCSLDPKLYQQTISMLEITGRISPLGGGKWRRS